MQSHASRHAVSEHLRDRLPLPGNATTSSNEHSDNPEVVTEAHGRRRIPKLLALVRSAAAPPEARATALHVLNALLPCGERKAEAVAAGAADALVACLRDALGTRTAPAAGDDAALAALAAPCCAALGELCHSLQGRAATTNAGGLEALAAALPVVPAAAAAALVAFALSADGAALLRRPQAGVVPALVAALGDPAASLGACADAAAALAAVCRADAGVTAACGAGTPAALLALMQRALRLPLLGAASGGGGGSEAGAVLREACACVSLVCHHPDGRAAVREAGGIPVVAAALEAALAAEDRQPQQPQPPQPGPALGDVAGLAAAALASLAVDPPAKTPIVARAGAALLALARRSQQPHLAAAAGAAAAALRLAVESLDARRKVEAWLLPSEMEALLGRLPATPPSYRQLVAFPPPPSQPVP